MSVKSSNVSAINLQLEDILTHNSCTISLSDLNDTQSISEAFYSACVELIARIHVFDSRVKFLPAFDSVTVVDVYETVVDLRPHFEISSTILKYRLLTFMCAHLQAEGIAVFEHNKKTVEQKGKVLFQLQKICRDLQIIDEVSDKEEAVIARVISHLTERIQEIPESLLRNPPKILARLNHDGRSVDEVLSLKQKEKVSRMVEILYEDFHLRRQMLMKRLDVTIESFLCGKNAEGKEGDLVTIIKAQRDHLSKVPIKYTLKDALEAPVSLLHESSKRVTDLGERSSGRLKIMEIMIGSVPDRGGRANELRSKVLTAGRGRGGGQSSRGRGRDGGGGANRADSSEGAKEEAKEEKGNGGDGHAGGRGGGSSSGGGRRKGNNRGKGRGSGGNDIVKGPEASKMKANESVVVSVDVSGEGKRKRDDDRNA